MKKSQWNVLGWGFAIIGIFFSIYNRLFISPYFHFAQELSTAGTSNLEVVTSLIFFVLTMTSLIFWSLAIMFWINGWLENK